MKRFSIFLILLIAVFSFALTMLNPVGPTIMPIAGLLSGEVKTDVALTIQFWSNLDDVIAKIASKRANFVALPVTTAANLYTKGINIKLIGVYSWELFYLVSTTEKFDGLKSLVGKTVYTAHGRGQTVDVLLRYMLSKEGIKPDVDVKFAYAAPQEIVALFRAGKVEYAAIPEPFVTMCLSANGKIVLDFQKEWKKVSGSKYGIPITGIFVLDEFKDYPRIVASFERSFKRSIDWMYANIDKAVEVTTKYLAVPAPILKTSMQRSGYKYIPAKECKDEVEFFLKTMQENYPEGMPKIPDSKFYYGL